MRKTVLALGLVLLIAAALPPPTHAQIPGIPGMNDAPPGPQPKIQVEGALYDFGSALEGAMVNHTFKIKNVGKSTLEIRGMKTSCGCTAATPTKNRLEPGEDSEIAVGFDTHFQKGHQVRTITALTNDPDNPQAVMTMQGIVKQQVAAAPDMVDFGDVHKGTAVTRTVEVTDLLGKGPFNYGPIENSNSSIKVTPEKRTDGKPGVILKVDLMPTAPVGTINDNIKVTTNRIPLNVNVNARITGSLLVDPPQVSFGIVPHGQDVVRILKFSNQGPHPVKIVDIASSNAAVSASVQPITPGKEYKITVLLRHGRPDGQLLGNLAIKTDDPEQTTLSVPFYAVVGQFRS